MQLLCWFVAFLIVQFSNVSYGDQPNVVVVLTDDQGWGDLSVFGNSNLETPNIDSLASDGTTIQYFYVCPVCAPTRAEFFTGRYYPRTGVSGVSRGEERLSADETTIANHFKQANYATGCFGKWHNGTQSPYHPNDRGFDEFYGFTSGHWSHYFSPPMDSNGTRVSGSGFIVDDITDHALTFIEENQSRPFFCYVPLNTPHSPMMVPDRFYETYENFEPEMWHRDPDREDIMMTRAALALCENIDWNVGRLLTKLDELDLRQNTIVVFFSDNGPNSFRWNGGMKGRKGSIDEGGVRSPFFIRWPDRIESGVVLPQVAGAIDLLPTLLELAEITPTFDESKPLDGRSFAPLLIDKEQEWEERSIFSIRRDQVSVRTQRFRLDANGALFDIEADPGQRVDVSGQYSDLVSDLRRQADRHRNEMMECFELYANRPFTVGYGALTMLPARDGVPHGSIERSSRAPNNSFFTNWTQESDSITWEIDVGQSGRYEAILYYTCAEGNQGVTIRLGIENGDSTQAVVSEVFDPPLFDKSKERVAQSHYFAKEFRPLNLGELNLERGRATLRLDSIDLQGSAAVDVHSIDLILQ